MLAGMRWNHAWLCLGPLLAYHLDVLLTLIGQPDAYWAGHLDQAREGNPFPRWLMHQHPLLFPLAALLWLPTFCAVILWLPARFAKWVAFLIQMGHTLAAGSWLVELAPGGYLAAVPFLYLSVKLMEWTWRRVPSDWPQDRTRRVASEVQSPVRGGH
ncbi:MAG: hypothetical protein JNM56_35545 [Planctomycetia bacterium]|nr:hypothetical protein [Planctomycetia bacterium]